MIWSGDIIADVIRKKSNTFLHEVGSHVQNQMALLAHFQEGVLKNSINYKVYDGYWSGFESQYGPPPPSDADVSIPQKGFVRIGSNLVYAGPQEKHNGFASKTIDTIKADGSIMEIAKRIFKLI